MSNLTQFPTRTHRIEVNLKEVFLNIKRAVHYIQAITPPDQRKFLPEFPPASKSELTCTISTIDELHKILQPALQAETLSYAKRWRLGQWYTFLKYAGEGEEDHYVMFSQSEIWMTESDQQCQLSQRLGYYLFAALDPDPPTPALSATDAAVAGAIRCLGTTQADCGQSYVQYLPPVRPAPTAPMRMVEQILNLRRLADLPPNEKLKSLYLIKTMDLMLGLVSATIEAAVQKGWDRNHPHIQELSRLMSTYQEKRPDLKTFGDDYWSQGDPQHVIPTLKNDLDTLFRQLTQSPVWQNQYTWFRNGLLRAGCTEHEDKNTQVHHVRCNQVNWEFDIATSPSPLAMVRTKKNATL